MRAEKQVEESGVQKLLSRLLAQSNVPFDWDYANLNKLAFSLQKRISLLQEQQQLLDERIQLLQEHICSDSQERTLKEKISLLQEQINLLDHNIDNLEKSFFQILVRCTRDLQTAIFTQFTNLLAEKTQLEEKELFASVDDDDEKNSDLKTQQSDIEAEIKILQNYYKSSETTDEICEIIQTAWQALMFQEFEKEHCNAIFVSSASDAVTFIKNLDDLQEKFVSFLLEKSKKYLPMQYHMGESDVAEHRFPSNATSRDPVRFAHKDQGQTPSSALLSASAPLCNEALVLQKKNEKNQNTMQSWLLILSRGQVKHIIILGFSKERLSYRETDGLLTTKEMDVTKEGSRCFNLIDKQANAHQIIGYSVFGVQDNCPLNLDDKELVELFRIYKIYENNTVLVHCDSGVGRTGQIRLLFALLDQFSQNVEFKKHCQDLMEVILATSLDAVVDLTSPIAQQAIETIFNTMVNTLNRLRQTRYCIQTEEQFTFTMPLLFLIIGVSQKLEDVALNKIRHFFGIEPPKLDARLVVDGAEMVESCTTTASRDASHAPSSHDGRSSQSSPLPRQQSEPVSEGNLSRSHSSKDVPLSPQVSLKTASLERAELPGFFQCKKPSGLMTPSSPPPLPPPSSSPY